MAQVSCSCVPNAAQCQVHLGLALTPPHSYATSRPQTKINNFEWNKPVRHKAADVSTEDEDLLRRVLTEKYYGEDLSVRQVIELLAKEYDKNFTYVQEAMHSPNTATKASMCLTLMKLTVSSVGHLTSRITRYGLQKKNRSKASAAVVGMEANPLCVVFGEHGGPSLDDMDSMLSSNSLLQDNRETSPVDASTFLAPDRQANVENVILMMDDHQTSDYRAIPSNHRSVIGSSWLSVIDDMPRRTPTAGLDTISATHPVNRLDTLKQSVLAAVIYRHSLIIETIEDLDMLEQLANLMMGSGWSRASSCIFVFLFRQWNLMFSRYTNPVDLEKSHSQMTMMLNRIFMVDSTCSAAEECFDEWESTFDHQLSHQIFDQFEISHVNESTLAASFLVLTLYRQGLNKFCQRATSILTRKSIFYLRVNDWRLRSIRLCPILTDLVCSCSHSRLMYLTPSRETHETDSMKRTVINQVLHYMLGKTSKPAITSEEKFVINSVWGYEASAPELERFGKRLLLALVCRSFWRPQIPVSLRACSCHLSNCIYQEWASGKSLFLTFAILCQMIKMQTSPSLAGWDQFCETSSTAIAEMIRDIVQTTNDFFEIAKQSDLQSQLSILGGSEDLQSDLFLHGRAFQENDTLAKRTFSIVCTLMLYDKRAYPTALPTSLKEVMVGRVDPPLNPTPRSSMSGLRSLKSLHMALDGTRNRSLIRSSSKSGLSSASYSMKSLFGSFSNISLGTSRSSRLPSVRDNLGSETRSYSAMEVED